LIVDLEKADHQPPVKENEQHLFEVAILNKYPNSGNCSENSFADNVRSRFCLSFVPASGLRSRPHCSSPTWRDTSIAQTSDRSGSVIWQHICNGCTVSAKTLSHRCKGVWRGCPV